MEKFTRKNTISSLLSSMNNEDDCFNYLLSWEKKYSHIEPGLKSFVPERKRIERIQQNIQTLRDRSVISGESLPLFGLPIGVKDIFHVTGLPTRAGSQLPSSKLEGSQANCVSKLIKYGAIVYGKMVTTEFAYFAPGPTMNPHNPKHTPGGSSSGSAAAVAAGLLPFAFGSQTIGSINRPASYCGVVGFKPTYNRISTEGVIPLSPSVDTVGFFVPDVPSANLISRWLLKDWKPSKTQGNPVIGIPEGSYLSYAQPEMLDHLEVIQSLLSSEGYQVQSLPIFDDFNLIVRYHKEIVAYEAAQVHKIWFDEFKNLYHPKTAELIYAGMEISQDEYQRALDNKNKFREQLLRNMEVYGVDLWLSPSAQGSAPRGLESTGDPIMNLPWSYCGFPTITIPTGINTKGLPLGMQFTAKWQKDEDLLNWVTDIEIIFLHNN